MKIPESRGRILWHNFLSFLLTITGASYSSVSCRKLFEKAKKEGPYDVIIVPGLAYHCKTWDLKMRARIYWAKILIDNGIAKNVMFSGNAVAVYTITNFYIGLFHTATRYNIYSTGIITENRLY